VVQTVILDSHSDDIREFGGGQHACLDRIWSEVGDDGVDLRANVRERNRVNRGHAGGILCSDRREGARPKDPELMERLQIRLNPRPPAGIASRDGHCDGDRGGQTGLHVRVFSGVHPQRWQVAWA